MGPKLVDGLYCHDVQNALISEHLLNCKGDTCLLLPKPRIGFLNVKRHLPNLCNSNV